MSTKPPWERLAELEDAGGVTPGDGSTHVDVSDRVIAHQIDHGPANVELILGDTATYFDREEAEALVAELRTALMALDEYDGSD
jgi:hypothetical protein